VGINNRELEAIRKEVEGLVNYGPGPCPYCHDDGSVRFFEEVLGPDGKIIEVPEVREGFPPQKEIPPCTEYCKFLRTIRQCVLTLTHMNGRIDKRSRR
jgi:hypothetical protein